MPSSTIAILPFNSHLRFTASLCKTLAETLERLCHVGVLVPSFGTASLSFRPTGEFIASIRPQLSLHLLSKDNPPLDNRSVVVLPQYEEGRLVVMTWYFDGEREIGARMCGISLGEVNVCIWYVFEQIRRSMRPSLNLDHHQALADGKVVSGHLLSFLNEFGIALAQDGKLESARTVWTQAIEQFPGSLSAIGNIGQSYSDQGRYDEAEDWFTTAIERSQEYSDGVIYYWNRGLARTELNKWPEALADFSSVTQADPNFGLAILNAANCLRRLGDFRGAERMYRRCATLQSDTSRQFGGDRDVRVIANEELKRF
jgi:tetratricopeptide (TPR) repeat protein